MMAGRDIPAPGVSYQSRNALHCSLQPLQMQTTWLEPSCPPGAAVSVLQGPCSRTVFCQMPLALNGSRERLVSGALPLTPSLAVTLSLWPKQSRDLAVRADWPQPVLLDQLGSTRAACPSSFATESRGGGRSCIKLISG